MPNKIQRLKRPGVGLVVVDIQEKLLPAIFEKDRMVRNSLLLIRAAQILNVPIVVTEQYRKGLGPTVREIANAIPNYAPLEKTAFSACGAESFLGALRARGVSDVVLCGIEAHVCVTQTCLDLLEHEFKVFIPSDAVASRSADNYRAGLDRMRTAGAVIGSTEMFVFEMLGRSGTEEFKRMLPLLK